MPCRALEAFRREHCPHGRSPFWYRLNALSGIGGVQTDLRCAVPGTSGAVLMPCRALEAFRHRRRWGNHCRMGDRVLMPCRALEAFRRRPGGTGAGFVSAGLNALSGIGGVQTRAGTRV